MEVKSIAGDNYLGGEDFNEALINYFCDRNSLKLDNMSLKMKAAIYKQAEKCKCELSNNASSEMVYQADNSVYRVVIDRDTYEKITNPLLLRLRQPIERALHDAQLMPQELDAIILIGGSTRIASVRSVVSKVFGKLPLASINPDEAVALGAAIQAALKDGNKALDETILTDVCPYTLGTNIVKRINNRYEGGYFFPIIERNTPIPVSRVERLYTVSDNQSKIECGIYQGESRIVENNVKLGELCIDINPAHAGKESIDVRFTYDINGILEVEVVTVSTGEKKRVVIEKDPGKFSSKEIEQRLALLKKLKIHPRERTENRLLIAKAERLYEEALGEERNIIAYHIDVFESILDLQDEVKTKKAAEEFKKFLDTYEGQYEFR